MANTFLNLFPPNDQYMVLGLTFQNGHFYGSKMANYQQFHRVQSNSC